MAVTLSAANSVPGWEIAGTLGLVTGSAVRARHGARAQWDVIVRAGIAMLGWRQR